MRQAIAKKEATHSKERGKSKNEESQRTKASQRTRQVIAKNKASQRTNQEHLETRNVVTQVYQSRTPGDQKCGDSGLPVKNTWRPEMW
ncbi:hypothetical protein Bpfe_006982 [Biomphalaria pfeifferi]|uniref:Uncharacterized protein n=1 Tax=Biomphalaria pfeifferi TaxID=112525 RepID=A0AAD8BYU5_BIOPF|nr:hypothetical protein Bpfe_006982 [Biomphalaria pfeifferi]